MEHARLKIVIESHVPYVRGIFEPFADVVYAEPDEITPELMRDADALITRTRTRVDSRLLGGSRCRVVATATIGTDHIDLPWCGANGIKVINAPGSNAPAVAQYVFAVIGNVMADRDLRNLLIGIVGVGNVGKIVERWAHSLGMKVLTCDPVRALAEGSPRFVSLSEIAARADIITFHTPMTHPGESPFPTFHLADEIFFNSLARKPLVINSARGAVVDTPALVRALDSGKVRAAAIDCWEGEPDISRELLAKAQFATPHIAGYSASGKLRASAAAVKGVSDVLEIPAVFPLPLPPGAPNEVSIEDVTSSYNPADDTDALRRDPSKFELLRNTYTLRKEVGE